MIKKDPSSIDKLVAKVIDNIQINIKNIYVRYEDSFSAPTQGNGKFVMGLLLKEFSIHTTASDWKTEIMSLGEELTHKLGIINNFSLFLDYETDSSKNIDIDRLINDSTNKVYLDILRAEFDHEATHHYIIDKFGLEARLKLNKNPLVNQLPQLEVDLLFGGQFKHVQPICVLLNVHQP